MVRLMALEYWHSFRPPHQTTVFVNPHEVASVRQMPFDERRCETVSEVVMQNGSKFLVEGSADAVAAKLGADECPTSL